MDNLFQKPTEMYKICMEYFDAVDKALGDVNKSEMHYIGTNDTNEHIINLDKDKFISVTNVIMYLVRHLLLVTEKANDVYNVSINELSYLTLGFAKVEFVSKSLTNSFINYNLRIYNYSKDKFLLLSLDVAHFKNVLRLIVKQIKVAEDIVLDEHNLSKVEFEKRTSASAFIKNQIGFFIDEFTV